MTSGGGLGPPYAGYLYAYPHKSAYRPLLPAPPLADVWRGERTDALFLYLHLPFCETRCGFCNLFTRALPPPTRSAPTCGGCGPRPGGCGTPFTWRRTGTR